MTLETLKTQRAFGGTQGNYQHASGALSSKAEFSVFQPDPARHPGPRPVVWFLSGLTCTPENFMTKAGAQRVAAELGLIVVAPDTSPRGVSLPGDSEHYWFGQSASYYVDATQAPYSQHYRMFSYLTTELPALVAEHFPADMARQGVSGHSMGGHGALLLALRQPGRFRRVSALAPIASYTSCPWGELAIERYFGGDRAAAEAFDPTCLLRGGGELPLALIDQGEADPFLKEQLRPELLQAALTERGVQHRLRLQPGYDHSYFFVATFIEEHLRFLAEAF